MCGRWKPRSMRAKKLYVHVLNEKFCRLYMEVIGKTKINYASNVLNDSIHIETDSSDVIANWRNNCEYSFIIASSSTHNLSHALFWTGQEQKLQQESAFRNVLNTPNAYRRIFALTRPVQMPHRLVANNMHSLAASHRSTCIHCLYIIISGRVPRCLHILSLCISRSFKYRVVVSYLKSNI